MKIFDNHEPKTVVQEQPQQAIYTQTPETQERDEVLSGNISSAPKQYVQPRQVLTPLNQNQPPTRVGNGIKEQDGVIDYGSEGGNKFAEEGEKEKWYADWEKTPFMDAIRSNNRAIYDNWGNYNEWAKENGKEPLDVFTVMRALQDKDGNKSFEENEQEKKKLERKQKWQRIGDVLIKLGNFAGALRGGPSAKYESLSELTARQQKVKDAVISQHNKALNNYITQYWKDKAAKRAKELNDANVYLRNTQAAREAGQQANEKAITDEKVKTEQSRQHNLESATEENQQQANYVSNKNKREEEMQPYKIKESKARANASNASANASNARAQSARAQADKIRKTTRLTQADADELTEYERWAHSHPSDFDKWNKDNGFEQGGIMGAKSPTKVQIKQFNRRMRLRYSGRRSGKKRTGVKWKN